MRRRDFLGGLAASACAGWASSLRGRNETTGKPLEIGLGPQLFLDDYLIDRLDGLKRRVQSPRRRDKPVLDSKTFGTTQPYLTALPDSRRKGYRLWYNHGPAIWHAESADGIHWAKPRVAWDLPRGYGASLVDDGDRAADPQRRFRLANWQATRAKSGDKNSGLYVGFSPDGLQWTAYDHNPVLRGIDDIVDVYYDYLTHRYAAAVKLPARAEDGYQAAPRAGSSFRRLVGMTTSKDFLHWDKPWRILVPDNKDDGLLEFYGMGGLHVRGRLRIGLARILRDDLACDEGGPKDGIGYAVLVTSRDGINWTRYREPFLDRNAEKGSWDHAMTWISGTLPVGDEVFFYYGGYARGHKIASKTERQIGLAHMKKDRYIALAPAKESGVLRTHPFQAPGDRLTINAKTADGDIRVRLLDAAGEPLADLGAVEADPIRGDALAAEVRWPKPLTLVRGKPIRLEIRVHKAEFFALDFH